TGASAPLLSQSLTCEFLQPARGVAEGFDGGVHAVQKRQPQVVDGRFTAIVDMPARLDRTASPSSDQRRKIVVVVPVAVRVAGTIYDHGVIQQRAVTFLD